jgi:hypothetical protein
MSNHAPPGLRGRRRWSCHRGPGRRVRTCRPRRRPVRVKCPLPAVPECPLPAHADARAVDGTAKLHRTGDHAPPTPSPARRLATSTSRDEEVDPSSCECTSRGPVVGSLRWPLWGGLPVQRTSRRDRTGTRRAKSVACGWADAADPLFLRMSMWTRMRAIPMSDFRHRAACRCRQGGLPAPLSGDRRMPGLGTARGPRVRRVGRPGHG